MKTPEQIAERYAHIAARGREMKRKIEAGICPVCGGPLDLKQPTRRQDEDHLTYPLSALVYVPCGCYIGCGHK